MSRYIVRLLQASAVGATGFYSIILLNYSFELMQQFALLLVLVVGIWVGGWIFLILALQRSERAILRRVGQALGMVMMYTALFQGMLYTVLVFMVVGYLQPDVALPATRADFIHDFLFGAGYLAALIHAAAGATLFFTRYRWRTRGLALLLALVGAGVPLAVLLTGALSDAVESDVNTTVVLSLVFALVISILLMHLLSAVEDPIYQRKAELRQRLKR